MCWAGWALRTPQPSPGEKVTLSDTIAKPDCAKIRLGFGEPPDEALFLLHFTSHFTVLLMNRTDHKSKEAMRRHNVPTVNLGETPEDSVSGKDTELATKEVGWQQEFGSRKEQTGHPRVCGTAQLPACLRVPECAREKEPRACISGGAHCINTCVRVNGRENLNFKGLLRPEENIVVPSFCLPSLLFTEGIFREEKNYQHIYCR